jgi:hypothetical protein
MRLSRVAGAVLLVFGVCGARAETPYALFSPQMVAQIKDLGPVDAGHVLAVADADLKAKPDPMSRVHTEGTLPHQGIRDESLVAEEDWGRMRDFALAYRLSGGNKKYLDAEARFLAAWTAVYKASLNPIDETNFDNIFVAFDLTRSDLPPAVQASTLALFASMSDGYLNFMEKNPCGKNRLNFQSHRIKLATLAAFSLGDPVREERARHAYETQVGCNIRPDGSVEDFYVRDALHYVVYDLDSLQTAALAARMHGQDWFHFKSPSGSSVPGAVDWLLPYTSGARKHDEFVHSTSAFDAARDKAGEKGYSGLWDVRNGVQTLALAALLDAKYEQPFLALIAITKTQPTLWIRLLQHMKF